MPLVGRQCVVAVHAGAGYYPSGDREVILKTCARACVKARGVFNVCENVVDSCVAATVEMENCPLTNAGVGSNLNIAQEIECDAGLMDSLDGEFAGVAAVSNYKNPIAIAQRLLEDRKSDNGPLVKPMLLAGAGAEKYALKNGLRPSAPDELITQKSANVYKRALESVKSNEQIGNDRMDTIGCVTVDSRCRAASSCSSGGILLKESGRVGHAAIFGAGCWAERRNNAVCCVSCSGCGEYLMKTSLARKVCDSLLSSPEDGVKHEILRTVLQEEYIDAAILSRVPDIHKTVGCICIFSCDNLGSREILWVHNSLTFPIAFWSSHMSRPRVLLSLNDSSQIKVGCFST